MSEPNKTLSSEDLARLKELAGKATPGPWKVGSWRDNVFSVTDENGWLPICRVQRNDHEATDDNPDVNDAAFIASSREAVPALIEMVEGLTNQRDYYIGRDREGERIERELRAELTLAERRARELEAENRRLREALEAQQAADDADEAHTELIDRAAAEGWYCDPDASIHLTDAGKKAAELQRVARKARRAAMELVREGR